MDSLFKRVAESCFPCAIQKIDRNLKAVFHSIISPPPAKNFDIEIIFLRSCAAEDTCSAGPVVENFHLLLNITLTARKNNEINFSLAKNFASGGEIREWKTGLRHKRKFRAKQTDFITVL